MITVWNQQQYGIVLIVNIDLFYILRQLEPFHCAVRDTVTSNTRSLDIIPPKYLDNMHYRGTQKESSIVMRPFYGIDCKNIFLSVTVTRLADTLASLIRE